MRKAGVIETSRCIKTGKKVTVPRHGEIENILAKEILKDIRGER